MRRGAAVFVSWVSYHGRSEDLAEQMGAERLFVAVGRGRLLTAVVRHPVQIIWTVAALARRRPRLLYVMTPPMPLVLLGLGYASLTGATLVIDAHSAAVVDRRTGRRVRWWFPPVARHADLTLVTTESLATELLRRGVTALPLHDPPRVARPSSRRSPSRPPGSALLAGRPVVVMPASWDPDEPVDAVLEAARRLPEVGVVVTGRPTRRSRLRARTLPNVLLVGQLPGDRYSELIDGCEVILALTTAEHTMQRAGYEALARGKPLVTSDTAVLRRYFSEGAVFVSPGQPDSIAAGIKMALGRRDELAREMDRLRDRTVTAWPDALRAVASRLDGQRNRP